MDNHKLYMIHSTTYEVTCDCGLLIDRDLDYALGEWLYKLAEENFLDKYHTFGNHYIIHGPSETAWGPISSFELAEQLLCQDKWFESWCYVGDQDSIDNFKKVLIYLPSYYDFRFQRYDMKNNEMTKEEFIL
jgi:hypothetical protein